MDKRKLLEVLKWTSPEDVLSHTSIVSRLWFEASESEEVWIALNTDLGFPLNPSQPQSSKAEFHRQVALLPVLSRRSLRTFDCRLNSIVSEVEFNGSVSSGFGTAAVMLPKGGLIVCGGGRFGSSIDDGEYYITPSGAIHPLHRMTASRENPSVALLKATLYVFCGQHGLDRSAEKLRIEPLETVTGRQWQPLPDCTSPHKACQPCAHGTLVYLCGGNTDQSEVFNTLREEYSLLPFTLPESRFSSVSFYRKGELVTITPNYVSRWRPGRQLQTSRNAQECSEVWTKMKQVLIGNSLFSVDAQGVRALDLSVGSRRFVYYFR